MSTSARCNLLALFAFALCLGWLFWPALFQSQIPAFRDAYHFYYPQTAWLDTAFRQGELFPVWNRFDGLGVSVPGQFSTAIYYPLRVVYWLPAFSLPLRFALFIITHLIIAAVGMRTAARVIGLRTAIANFAGASFALSCPVFFQHNNLIYLTSAAWIGFVLAALAGCLCNGMTLSRATLMLTIALCMMTLGGDPHTAINAMLLCTVASFAMIVASWWASRRGKTGGEGTKPSVGSLLGRCATWLIVSMIIATIVTAAQWIPAARASRISDRTANRPALLAASENPTPPSESQSPANRLLREITANIQVGPQPTYDFSLPPWQILTTIWPTLTGHYLPTNSRWIAAWHAEGRMWIPSLYFGFLPLLLVLVRTPNGFTRSEKALVGLAVFAFLAAIGNYSIGWLAREVASGLNLAGLAAILPQDHTSSVYGFLASVLPGYDAFRYPAKWTVWFSAACCLLAAARLQRLSDSDLPLLASIPRWMRFTIIAVSTVICLLGIAALLSPLGSTIQAALPSDPWLGKGNVRAVAMTLILASAIPLCVIFIARLWPQQVTKWFVPITLVEMTLVASNWTTFVPPPQTPQLPLDFPSTAFVWADFTQASLESDFPAKESAASNAERQAQYQNIYLLGKLGSGVGIRNLTSVQTIDHRTVAKSKAWLAAMDDLSENQPRLDRVLRSLGVTHRLVRLKNAAGESQFRWQLLARPTELCELFDAKEQGTDSETHAQLPATQTSAVDAPQLSWQWPSSAAIEIEVETAKTSHLLIRQLNDGGWRVSPPAIVLPNSGPLLELSIPPGKHRIEVFRKHLW